MIDSEILELKKTIAYQAARIVGLTSEIVILKAQLAQEKKDDAEYERLNWIVGHKFI